MDKSIYSALKKTLIMLLCLNSAIVLVVIYLAFSNYKSQRNSLIEMGYTVLRAFEASRPVIFSTGRNDHLAQLLNEMFDLNTINNIVIYRQNGETIFTLHPQDNIIKTDINGKDIDETSSEIILYNSFHLMSGMAFSNESSVKQDKKRTERTRNGNFRNHKIFIAIAINKNNLNSIRNYSLITSFIALAAVFMILFLYLRIKQIIHLYEESLINLKNAEKDAATGRLASVLAHEIKNPLSSMSGLLSFAKKKNSNEQLDDIINRTKDEVERLSGIVNDFLTYGRSVELQLSDVSAKKIINKTVELLNHDANSKNITFQLSGNDFTFIADESKMLQIFVNIILNAIYASPSNELININLDSKSMSITIINKTIKPVDENVERFFEPFYTTKTKGSGLGLSITKRLLEQHGYSIAIHSTAPFTVVITFGKK